MNENNQKMPKSIAKRYFNLSKLIANPQKSGKNANFGNYTYSNRDDIARVLRPALNESGLSLDTYAEVLDKETIKIPTRSGFERVVVRYTVKLHIILRDEDGEEYRTSYVGESIDGDDKGIPKAVTQAYRQWAINTFSLTDGGEDWMYAGDQNYSGVQSPDRGGRQHVKPENVATRKVRESKPKAPEEGKLTKAQSSGIKIKLMKDTDAVLAERGFSEEERKEYWVQACIFEELSEPMEISLKNFEKYLQLAKERSPADIRHFIYKKKETEAKKGNELKG